MIRYSRAMGKGAKKKKNRRVPRLDSDEDFLRAFEETVPIVPKGSSEDNPEDKHGVKRLDSLTAPQDQQHENETEDFKSLLEESFKNRPPRKKTGRPSVPLKKRLRRYPPVEAELDLHGFTAIGAQVKAKSFVITCKQQGLFTIRIIVGKGLHSDLGPVLPDVIEDVAKDLKHQDIVLSYQWEKKKKTRSGALIIYLKQFDQYD